MRSLSGSNAYARCSSPKTEKQMVIDRLGNGDISQLKDELIVSI